MSQGEYIEHTFTAESLANKYINEQMREDKLVRRGFDLEDHISVEVFDDGSRRYRQFVPKNKVVRQN